MSKLTGSKSIRVLTCLLAIALCLLSNTSIADGFVEDAASINKAANSVLMLEVYNQKKVCIATGSGFVAFNSSTLITNYHVIDGGSYIIANTDDGSRYKVSSVLCANENFDIAILLFDSASDITPLKLYCGEDMLRGESVVAIGSPIGITNTVSKGNISALYTEDDVPWIQFTAPISSGSSGGVLLNDDGLVIGITSRKYTNGENMNLAVRAVVAQAMYNSWDGKTHSFASAPKASKVDYSKIYEEENDPKDSIPDSTQWTCPNCNNINTSLFCVQCGKARPEWTCQCGQSNLSPYCGQCGSSVAGLLSSFEQAYVEFCAGNYQQAATEYTNLKWFSSGTYETSVGINAAASDQISECYYAYGKQLLDLGNYTEAIFAFTMAGSDYLDSDDRIKEAYYFYAEELLAAGNYSEASTAFTNAKDYSDATLRILEPYYVQGKALQKEENYTEALEIFAKCLNYSDTKEVVKQINYQIGVLQFAEKDFNAAISSFSKAGDYSDAVDKVTEVRYAKAISYGEKQNYVMALSILRQYRTNEVVR